MTEPDRRRGPAGPRPRTGAAGTGQGGGAAGRGTRAKLTAAQVAAARRMWAVTDERGRGVHSAREIAELLGVSQWTVRRAVLSPGYQPRPDGPDDQEGPAS